jgi:lipid-A-disaccharide synthase
MASRMLIVTGEVSGDVYGSRLASEIGRIDPGVDICGVGGDRMREAGVEIFLDSGEISVVGFWEAILSLEKLRRALDRIKAKIDSWRPDLLVLIDYPGMNLRLARHAKSRGVKVMYYVSPQVWAWGRSRIKMIRRTVDKMAVILPFELDIYRNEGIDVTYVGHPLVDIVRPGLGRDDFFDSIGLETGRPLVSLLPGSRVQEIRHHLGPMLGTITALREKMPEVQSVIAGLPGLRDLIRQEIERAGADVALTTDRTYEALAYSDLALACSGTATLEAALLGTPAVVIYKLAFFSWVLGRMIVRVPYISLVNLIAGEEVVPEFIQGDVEPRSLAAEAHDILVDNERRQRIIDRLKLVRDRLGSGGATTRAAEIALGLIGQ